MKVVVVVASKHGSTRAIAEVVSDELRAGGCEVTIADAAAQGVLSAGYDAAVIGSAVYVGNWMKDARNFVEENQEVLRKIPLWLFSSGPLGEAPKPDELGDVRALALELGARDHRIFAGNLDKADLSLAERAAVRLVHAPYGDARDWEAIRSWAKTIAADLTRHSHTPVTL